MTFLECYSCDYRKACDEYYNIIHEKYPEITIRGANYDPPGLNMYLSKVLLVTKLLMIIAWMSNFDVFGYLWQPIPSWWRWCTENKLYACMMDFFLGNMLEAQLILSEAFEILLNDVPVWSKLEKEIDHIIADCTSNWTVHKVVEYKKCDKSAPLRQIFLVSSRQLFLGIQGISAPQTQKRFDVKVHFYHTFYIADCTQDWTPVQKI